MKYAMLRSTGTLFLKTLANRHSAEEMSTFDRSAINYLSHRHPCGCSIVLPALLHKHSFLLDIIQQDLFLRKSSQRHSKDVNSGIRSALDHFRMPYL